ncbi:uncharacterized protein LOC143532392 [Bidens hawaiensis]|uniref:uncharacterized protein LOC143532392 n=1 Tax=Bidens hawaiensis TaxID=980011 RepID=UPI0040495EFC
MEGNLIEEKISNKRGREDDNDEKGVVGRLEKRASGVVVLEEYNGDEMINGVKYEEEKEATTPSLFNQLITNLVNSPKPSDHKPEAEFEKIKEEKCTINSKEKDKDKDDRKGDSAEVVEDEKDKNIIDSIVARLPRTLSEDRAPATDEASILIHSIIHD